MLMIETDRILFMSVIETWQKAPDQSRFSSDGRMPEVNHKWPQ